VQELVSEIKSSKAESVGGCLLFSFLHPKHEAMLTESLRSAGYFVSVSSEILPEFRESEHCSNTVMNAYVSPVFGKYLTYLENSLDPAMHLSIMQSNGAINRYNRGGMLKIMKYLASMYVKNP
jgi:N-methylhydantoinase A